MLLSFGSSYDCSFCSCNGCDTRVLVLKREGFLLVLV
jgi:hypothetical protein